MLLQRKTLIETKNCRLKCLKQHYSTVRSMKNVAVLTADGAFALFFRPHPRGFDSSRVPTTGNLGGVGVLGVLGAGGIDWCISSQLKSWSCLRTGQIDISWFLISIIFMILSTTVKYNRCNKYIASYIEWLFLEFITL